MHQVVLVPNNTGATACMYYNTKESAEAALENIHQMQRKEDVVVRVKDDYGFVLSMDVRNLAYALLIDVEQSHVLHGGAKPKPALLNS